MSLRERSGAAYVAVVRLSDKQNRTLAEPGESCARVPASSLPWLVAQGLIVPAPAAAEKGDE